MIIVDQIIDTAEWLKTELEKIKDLEKVEGSRFHKTWKCEYGEGDVFWGISVPDIRKVAKMMSELDFWIIEKLLEDEVHEVRYLALEILTFYYAKVKKQLNEGLKKDIVDFYIWHLDGVNSWDLVDTSCYFILWDYLIDKPRDLLYEYARSNDLWIRRIWIVSTLAFIRAGDTKDVFGIAEMVLSDTRDLIHKATGWMLREAGKKDIKWLEKFLDRYAATMPRTMLRYALEKFEKSRREYYMKLRKDFIV